MASILFKWFLAAAMFLHGHAPEEKMHPFYVSVAEIEHNATTKTLEISCKIFTDDFENTLRAANKHIVIDLINPPDKSVMDRIVNAYVQKNFKLIVNGQAARLR